MVHTDGWGNPIQCPARRCPRCDCSDNAPQCDHCKTCPHADGPRPEQPPQATPLEEAQATIEGLRYQIRRAREALATDETPTCCSNCGHEAAIAELAQAIRLTREYVGEELLPPIEGWSWYDALRRHAPHELPATEEAS